MRCRYGLWMRHRIPSASCFPARQRGRISVKVIGAGFGRTGTSSIKAALEEIGFGPCYHVSEIAKNPDHLKAWRAAALGEPVHWREVLKGYEATTLLRASIVLRLRSSE